MNNWQKATKIIQWHRQQMRKEFRKTLKEAGRLLLIAGVLCVLLHYYDSFVSTLIDKGFK